jgi:hypothetical protein
LNKTDIHGETHKVMLVSTIDLGGAMHILVLLLGLVVGIGAWYWRIKAATTAVREIGDLAKEAANLPRKLRFQRLAGKTGLLAIDDAREAAAILMMEMARSAGEVSSTQKQVMAEQIASNLGLSADDAGAMVVHAGWVLRDSPLSEAVIRRMCPILLKQVGEKEIHDLDQMLIATSRAEGDPTGDQLELLRAFRARVGISI